VRDTKLMNGCAFARVTDLAWSIPLLRRAEVVIAETLLGPGIMP
jgi:hypothetical protein